MQLEFGFMEELREAEQREKAEKRNLPYFDTPRDDNQRLLNYQHDWLTNGDEKAWEKLWELARKVARRMIRAQQKKKGFRLDRLDEDDRVDTAVIYVLRRYRDGWWVRKAYLKAIKEGVVHALWYRTMRDEYEDSVSDDVLGRIRIYDEADDGGWILVEGMTREKAEAMIRAEFLPEIADSLLAKIRIIGGKK